MPSKKKRCVTCNKVIPGRWFYCEKHITADKRAELGKVYRRDKKDGAH